VGVGVWSALAVAATAATATEPGLDAPPAADSARLRPSRAVIALDYQVIRVRDDKPIDLMGLHWHYQVADWLFVGAGAYAPLVRGEYGGFTAYDLGGHVRQRLTPQLFATLGVSGGGGGGGRSVEQSKLLSGSGRFYKAYTGLGYDFGSFSLGVNLAKMKFSQSKIDGTQANAFLEIPFSYLTGPFSSRGQPLSAADARLAAQESAESMLSVVFDNIRQIKPEGSYKGSIQVADLQYAHYLAPDTYWWAGLGVGMHGLPLYNHILGGVGQRLRLSPRVSVYGQLGIGSGGYAPQVMNTDAGLLVYPRVSAEFAVTRDVGLSLSAGTLVAPKGSSRNLTWGLALTQHIGGREPAGLPTYQGYRVSLLQQTETSVRYHDLERGGVQLMGLQFDLPLDDHWYLPVQASVAYTDYLGYPGYGEVLTGVGLQSRAGPDTRWQVFGQLMAGANVHGKAGKASAGLRYLLSDRLAAHLSAGRIEARGSAGQRFSANSWGLGLDYGFSVPGW
jgi:hypothetical protein